MKGMALSFIAEIIIGVASLLVLLMLFTPLPQALSEGYCYMHSSFVSAIPFPEGMRPAPPSFCSEQEKRGFERVYIRERDADTAAMRIASYALSCWKMSGDGSADRDIICFEIYVPEISSALTEADILSKIPSEYAGNIVWKASPIGPRSVTAVYFSKSEGKVVIE